MRLLSWKAKRRYLVSAVSVALSLALLFFIHRIWTHTEEKAPMADVSIYHHGGESYYDIEDLTPPSPSNAHDQSLYKPAFAQNDLLKCTMSTCFDVTRCLSDFKVYVYPPEHSEKPSPMYKKFLTAIRESPYYTNKPRTACLLILNLDTLDRDKLSNEFVRHLSEKIHKLPHWNGGRNHLIFNFFSGSYPDYSEELDFPYGEAILAKASFSTSWYRNGFDISLPLLGKKHRDKGKEPGTLTKHRNLYPIHRRYLLTFKGKRYLWGHGSETRNSLHHLHNGRDIIMLTTCKHGKNWDQFVDDRCSKDNALYDRYDFSELISNSTFCLVPRGRRLGSFRFMESLQAGCIPVSLSNGFVLPFEEVIDWQKASLTFDERQLFQLPYILRNFPSEEIFAKRIHTQLLWEEYFSSVEKVVMATLEIIKNRIYRTHGQFVWNRYPGALGIHWSYSQDLSDYPFYHQNNITKNTNYTAVIMATKPAPKGDSPLVLLIKKICNSLHLSKVVVLWIGRTPPKVMLPSHCTAPVDVVKKEAKKTMFEEITTAVKTDAILMLWEDTDLISDEAEFGFQTWLSFPDRLVGFQSYRHYWDPTSRHWKASFSLNNQYSLVSMAAAFIHRYYIHCLAHHSTNTMALRIADTSLPCLDVALNLLVSDVTHKPPIKLTHRTQLAVPDTDEHQNALKSKSVIKAYSNCLNTLYETYGQTLPLYSSISRADPVLFYDDVSALRKEFRRIENRI